MLPLIGREEVLKRDWFQSVTERSKHVRDMYQMVDEAMPSKTTEEWLALFREADIPCGAVNSLEDLFDDPQLRDTGFFQNHEHPSEGPLTIPRHPIAFDIEAAPEVHAPLIGEQSREVLSEAGLSDDTIDLLIADGVVGQS
jgi:crotonobetainyl-CoA:carnitine CoA-transferase CaiB-like acyl-CoA transferase